MLHISLHCVLILFFSFVLFAIDSATSIEIISVAGTGDGGTTGDGSAATSAKLKKPYDIAIDTSGNIYIADTFNNKIRKVTRLYCHIFTTSTDLDALYTLYVSTLGHIWSLYLTNRCKYQYLYIYVCLT